MSKNRLKLRVVTGAGAALAVVATSMLTGASGASAHTAEQMEQLAPILDRMPQGELLANYLGGDGSLMRAYLSNPSAGFGGERVRSSGFSFSGFSSTARRR